MDEGIPCKETSPSRNHSSKNATVPASRSSTRVIGLVPPAPPAGVTSPVGLCLLLFPSGPPLSRKAQSLSSPALAPPPSFALLRKVLLRSLVSSPTEALTGNVILSCLLICSCPLKSFRTRSANADVGSRCMSTAAVVMKVESPALILTDACCSTSANSDLWREKHHAS
eukprot:scaffold186230_cov35-Tisochrysis_lutea.AAC.3